MLRFATMDEWWQLTARWPEHRRESHTLLKDYGYLKLIDCIEVRRPARLLEFGHGFNRTILERYQDRCEVYGVDDYQALPYFPDREQWEAWYEEHVAGPCPNARLVRGLLGGGDLPELGEGAFDLICSVSVLEELDEETVKHVVGHAERLLAPGGVFVGTIDIPLSAPAHSARLVDAVAASGLAFAEPPAASEIGDFNRLLIESPTVVMLTYQMNDGDDRTFRGHWGTAWFVAEKPAAAEPAGAPGGGRRLLKGIATMGTRAEIPEPATLDPLRDFRTDDYRRINERRLEHLATLGLPIHDRTVLELGAGVGDLTGFFLDRGCRVTVVEGRAANVAVLRERFARVAGVDVVDADLNDPPASLARRFDVVFADGVLYHLARPAAALAWMAERCAGILFVSTCVSLGAEARLVSAAEDPGFASQALDGRGCRPTRRWVYETMRVHLPHVYTAVTQPNHDEFPLDWNAVEPPANGLSRAVFVGSRTPIDDPRLVAGLPATHERSP